MKPGTLRGSTEQSIKKTEGTVAFLRLAAAAVVLDLLVVQMQRERLVPLGMQPAEEERLLARAALHDHLERRR